MELSGHSMMGITIRRDVAGHQLKDRASLVEVVGLTSKQGGSCMKP
jgi:hypothetical protein